MFCNTKPDLDLQEVHDFLVKLALEAGQAIASANPNTLDSDTKKNCKFENVVIYFENF